MFDDNISIFRTFDSDPKAITLGRWIRSTLNGNNTFAKQVLKYRNTGDDSLKKSLPLATVGALCEDGRKLENVKERTGWIALDIDAKDNPEVEDSAELRDNISKIVYVAFAGLSVSGNGVWALVKVEDPQKQEQYFKQLQHDFKHFGIVLDSTKGKNPNDARFYSYDPDAVISEDFKIYDRLPKNKTKRTGKPTRRINANYSLNDTRDKVETLISKIQDQRIDITEGYENWRDLGFAFEDEFGEQGRDYFHAISEMYPGYDPKECDRQFIKCVRHRGSGISIGTFFYECRKHGITLGNDLNGSNGEYEADKNTDSENSATYGINPYTGEVFDERGYPVAWDDITLDEDSQEYHEATKQAINDAAPDELEQLCRRDPTVKKLINLFDGEVKTASDIILN
mgnify:CR=1 FL=1